MENKKIQAASNSTTLEFAENNEKFKMVLAKAHQRKTPQKSTLNLLSNAFSTTKTLMMMDVSIDRRVEISKSVQSQWKSRNVSSIQGMQIIIKALVIYIKNSLKIKRSKAIYLKHRTNKIINFYI